MLEIEFDPNRAFYNSVQTYEWLVAESCGIAATRLKTELDYIVLSTIETAMVESGMPAIYQAHLLQGVTSNLKTTVSAASNILVAQVFDIAELGDIEDLIRGFHYHAIAAIGSRKEFSQTNPPRIELPYTGQAMYNEDRPERRLDFWDTLVEGATYIVTVTRRSRKKGGGTVTYTIEVPTSGMYDETLAARVATWGNRYPEWILLENGSGMSPTGPDIQATHVRSLIEERVYAFMSEVFEAHFNALIDAWNEDFDAQERTSINSTSYSSAWYEDTWTTTEAKSTFEKFFDRHMYEDIRFEDYSYEPKGRGSKIRGPGGRFA